MINFSCESLFQFSKRADFPSHAPLVSRDDEKLLRKLNRRISCAEFSLADDVSFNLHTLSQTYCVDETGIVRGWMKRDKTSTFENNWEWSEKRSENLELWLIKKPLLSVSWKRVWKLVKCYWSVGGKRLSDLQKLIVRIEWRVESFKLRPTLNSTMKIDFFLKFLFVECRKYLTSN